MYTIELFIDGNVWMAKNSNPTVKELFDTDTIPTAFASNATPQGVLNRIKELNPEYHVFLR
jgi:hypothetical protein